MGDIKQRAHRKIGVVPRDTQVVIAGEPEDLNRSVIGRLLEELSWAGRTIRDYRMGGAGYENVLVAETMIALDFLPRAAFLGAVIAAATGAPATRAKVVAEIELAELLTLPPETKLRPTATTYQEQVVVQPDASLIGPNTYTLIEAKRIKQGSFQEEQLARELVTVTREAKGRQPLLLLIIPAPPPVLVSKLGRVEIEDAIGARLEVVLARVDHPDAAAEELIANLNETVAWVTWEQLATSVEHAHRSFQTDDPSIAGSIDRLCSFIGDAVQRHS